MIFLNFPNFFSIFLEFSIMRRVITKWNDNFFFPLSQHFQPILALNEVTMVFFIFFPIFLEFSITRQVGTEQDDRFYFTPFSAFPPLFWLEMKP